MEFQAARSSVFRTLNIIHDGIVEKLIECEYCKHKINSTTRHTFIGYVAFTKIITFTGCYPMNVISKNKNNHISADTFRRAWQDLKLVQTRASHISQNSYTSHHTHSPHFASHDISRRNISPKRYLQTNSQILTFPSLRLESIAQSYEGISFGPAHYCH